MEKAGANSSHLLRTTVLATGAAIVGTIVLLRWRALRKLFPRTFRIQRLFLFPIKGGAPIEVDELHFDKHGFKHDRRWAVVNSKNEVVTLRTCTRLVLVKPEVIEGPSPALALSAPGMPRLEVPFPGSDAQAVDFSLWTVPGSAKDCGPEAARWLQDFLGQEYRLAYIAEEVAGVKWREMCKQAAWNGGDESKSVYYPGTAVGFADSNQGTVISSASVDALNRRLRSKLTVERFRMNLVLAGTDAYEEESWTSFGIGDKTFVMSRMCNRCTVTLVDHTDGVAGPEKGEPLRELRAYRSPPMVDHCDPRHKEAPILGMKFGTSCVEGAIRVGDEVTPLTVWKPGDRLY